jgi:hypothetical protein
MAQAADFELDVQPDLDVQPEMSEQEFTRQRQQAATQDPTFRAAAGAVIPTVAGAASMIPGVGPVLGAGISAGGTALNQALGMEPRDESAVVTSGLLNLLAPGLIKAGKGIGKAAAGFFAPQAMREAAAESAAGVAGATKEAFERASEKAAGARLSKTMFQTARQVGPVNSQPIKSIVDSTIGELNGILGPKDIKTLNHLSGLSRSLSYRKQVDYGDVMDAMQTMRHEADALASGIRPRILSSRNMHAAREKMLKELDAIDPSLAKANAQYRKEEATDELVKAFRKSEPNVAVRQLFEDNTLVAGAFSKSQIDDIKKLTDDVTGLISRSPSGAIERLIQPLGRLLTNDLGRAAIRQVLKAPAGNEGAKLATLMQFARALSAQP